MNVNIRNLVISSLGLAMLASCTNEEGFDNRWYVTTDSKTYNFGTVQLGQTSPAKSIWLTNSGKKPIILGRMDQVSLGLSNSTFDLLEEQSSCTTSLLMQPGGKCQLKVTATPWVETLLVEAINLSWSNDQGEKEQSRKISLQVTGSLDCQSSAELSASYNDGAQAGLEENEDQYELGYQEGLSATYQDGYDKGYGQAYSSNYNASYETAYSSAYNNSYENAYANAYMNTDASDSCNDGSQDGFNDGYYNGSSLGSTEGYDYGWYDGSSWGYYDGYYVGYDDGYDSCSSSSYATAKKSSKTAKVKAAKSKSFPELCYDKGYSSTYDTTSFSDGEELGLSENDRYQDGLSSGKSVGKADGIAAGTRAGTDEGNREGTSEGTTAGAEAIRDDVYSLCYEDEYYDGYSTGYYVAFDEYYNYGYTDGYAYGWDAGYLQGEEDGCYDATYGSYATMAKTKKSAAYGKSLIGNSRISIGTKKGINVLVSKTKIKSARSSTISTVHDLLKGQAVQMKEMSAKRSKTIKIFNRKNMTQSK